MERWTGRPTFSLVRILLIALFVSSCSAPAADVVSDTSTTPTLAASTTTSSTSTTTSTTTPVTPTTVALQNDERWLQDEPPKFNMVVSNPDDVLEFKRLTQEFFVFRAWLGLHPFEATAEAKPFVDTVLAPGSRISGSFLDGTTDRFADPTGHRVPPGVIGSVLFEQQTQPTDGAVRVVVLEALVGRIEEFDRVTGEITDVIDATFHGYRTNVYVWVETTPNDWRLADIEYGDRDT